MVVVNDAKKIYQQYQQLQTMLTQLKQYKTRLRMAKTMFTQKAKSAFFDSSDAAQRDLAKYRRQVDKQNGKQWLPNFYQTRSGDKRMSKACAELEFEARENEALIIKFIKTDLPYLVKLIETADQTALKATQGSDKDKNLAARQVAMLNYQSINPSIHQSINAKINIKMMTIMHYMMRAKMIEQRMSVEVNKDQFGTNKPEG